jgi:hypothetical protein
LVRRYHLPFLHLEFTEFRFRLTPYLRPGAPIGITTTLLFTTLADILANMAGHQDSTLQLRTPEQRDTANRLLKDAGVAVTPPLLGHAVANLPLITLEDNKYAADRHSGTSKKQEKPSRKDASMENWLNN